MSDGMAAAGGWARVSRAYHLGLKASVIALAVAAGFAVLVMIGVTCLDVVLRLFRFPLRGAYDVVNIAGTLALVCALPYTTAVKGHVAVELLFHKLGGRGRWVLDTAIRLLIIALFSAFTWQGWRYAEMLKAKGQVTPTLKVPEFWVAYPVAVACALVVLVTWHHLWNPGREMIKP